MPTHHTKVAIVVSANAGRCVGPACAVALMGAPCRNTRRSNVVGCLGGTIRQPSPHLGRGDRLYRTIEIDPLKDIPDIPAVIDVSDVRQRHDQEASFKLTQRMFDPRAHIFKYKRVLRIGALRVTHRDADLADPAQTLGDQGLVTVVKWLVAADEQCGRLLGVEGRPNQLHDFLRPVVRRSFGSDPHVI